MADQKTTKKTLDKSIKEYKEYEDYQKEIKILRYEKALLDEITTNMFDLVSITDLQGRYKWAGKSHEILGYSKKTLLEQTVFEKIHPEDLPRVLEAFKAYLIHQIDGTRVTYRIQKADGRYLWLETMGKFLRDEMNQPKEILFSSRDVTEQKEIEYKLFLRDQLLHNLSQQVPGAVYQYLLRPDGTSCFPFTSSGIHQIYEVTPEQVKEDASIVFERIHPDDLDQVKASIQQSANTMTDWEDQYRVILPLQGERHVLGSARPEKLSDGSILWYGYLRDVTKNKQIEEQVYVEKEHFKTTLLSVGDGIIACDNQGKITVMNPIAEILTGYTQEEAIGKSTEEVFYIIHERTKEVCQNPVQKVLLTGESIELENHTMLISKDKKEYIIEDSVAPIKDRKGNITGVVIVFRDCTDKDQKQKQIQHLSYHDYLTGIYNRRYLEKAIKQLDYESSLPFTYMVIDINGLKLTNDAFGHAMGDQLLKRVSNILKEVCRSDEIIGRMGCDEFAILLPNTNAKQAERIKVRIKEATHKERLDSIVVSVAIGYAVKTDMNQTMDTIIKNADNLMYKDKLKYGKTMRNETIEMVLRSINNKYDKEQIHTERVSQYCEVICQALGVEEKEAYAIKVAGMLHDIGKIMVPMEILNKPGRLTEEEYGVIKKHSETGYQILKSVDEYMGLSKMVLHHHETWDGKGYPEGLCGEDIPLGSRIIAIADAFEAMTAERSYQKTKSREEALDEIKRCAGSQFDPNIAEVFIKAF